MTKQTYFKLIDIDDNDDNDEYITWSELDDIFITVINSNDKLLKK